jgi:membrane-associated protease RseP (regulator of RpoE activity)
MQQPYSLPSEWPLRAPTVPLRRVRRRGPLFHLILFAVTFFTSTLSGALVYAGVAVVFEPSLLSAGLPFSVTLMSILLAHEVGHYVLARVHRVEATLPFFIPGPPIPPLPGTLGAVIRMRNTPQSRRALFDIGAAGPWAGLLVAFPAVVIGLRLSDVQPLDPRVGADVLGDSLLFSLLTRLVLGVDPSGFMVDPHPMVLAGWWGLLVTAMNLMPVGQLDGGHVMYAAFGRYHRWISWGMMTFLVVLGVGGSYGWLVWAALLFMIGLDHPVPADPATPLGKGRMTLAVLTMVMFVLTFVPFPLSEIQATVPAFDGELVPVSAPAPPRAVAAAL